MADTQKKSTKTLAIITYAVTLVCLLAGLLFPPNFDFKGDYNAVIMQIPHALNCLGITMSSKVAYTYAYGVSFWGGKAFDIGGLFMLLYVLVGVVAVIGLISVLCGKKDKDTSIKSAGFVEVLSTLILSVLAFMKLTMVSYGDLFFGDGYKFAGSWDLVLVIAFGGPLLMLIVQSIASKGSSGFIKTLIVIFSAISIVFCVYSFAAVIPQLAEPLKNIVKDTKLIDWTTEKGPLGALWVHLLLVFNMNYGEVLKGLSGMDAAVCVFMLILGVVVIANFLLDVCGLAKKTKRWMLLSNLIRYGLEVILVLLVLILGGIVGKHTISTICYLLLGIAALLTLINVIRFVSYKDDKKQAKNAAPAPKKKAAAPAPKAKPAPQPRPQPQTYAQPDYSDYYDPYAPVADEPYKPAYTQPQPAVEQPKLQPAPAPAAPVAAQSGNVYSPVIYSGPRDEFIDTLTNEERVEFARTFIERRNGTIQGVPEYVVDGNNEKFFKSLFIYYSRVRGLVSDALMNKFYEKVCTYKK